MSKPDRILAQELLEREVLDLAAGEIIGTVVDFALTREGQVQQVGVLPLTWFLGGRGLAPQSIVSINQDRICIQDGSTLSTFDPDGEKVFSALFGEALHGKVVLQQDGEQLGRLADFSFNLADGQITDLIVLDAEGKRVRVPVESLKTIGRHYIVVEKAAAPESLGKADAAWEQAASEPTITRVEVEPVAGGAMPEDPAAPEIPAEMEAAPPPAPAKPAPAAKPAAAPAVAEGVTRSEEKAALFGEGKPKIELSKFDQKKRDYLRGKPAHRDLKDKGGQPIAAKGEVLSDDKLEAIVAAGILGEVFVEMTLNK